LQYASCYRASQQEVDVVPVFGQPDPLLWFHRSDSPALIVFSSKLLHSDRFKLHKKKLFRGHNNAGFACGITTPPDGALCATFCFVTATFNGPSGAYVCSGDADGRVFIWDWKSCKIYKKFQAHEKVHLYLFAMNFVYYFEN